MSTAGETTHFGERTVPLEEKQGLVNDVFHGVADRYDLQDPATVAVELRDAATSMAGALEAVGRDQWQRTGVRSDGAVFTIDTFTRYFVHDPIHHLDDVRRGNEILASGELD